jgi:hypothetical protein
MEIIVNIESESRLEEKRRQAVGSESIGNKAVGNCSQDKLANKII